MKKITLLFTALFALSACSGNGKDEPKIIDNTANALKHDKIYLWNTVNVAYDGVKSGHDYIFMTPYLAPYPTGGAVLVFPGGAYTHLSNSTKAAGESQNCTNNDGEQREASDIAQWYNAQGISVFVVNYRTKGLYTNSTTKLDGTFCYKQLLSDGLRAVKMVRHLAKTKPSTYHINENKIGVLGYSAGGNLAAEVLTHPDWKIEDENFFSDTVDRVSAKVSGAVLSYAVLDFESNVHAGTRTNFLGPETDLADVYNPINCVTPSTSPCYIWAEKNDASVKYQNSTSFAAKLTENGVQNECHIFEDTGFSSYHGIGCAQDYPQAKVWPEQSTTFLKNLGF